MISDPNNINTVLFTALLYKNAEDQEKDLPLATGWAFEIKGDGYVNKTIHLENCETSAIGRALANIGICGKNRASYEEMIKVQRMLDEDKNPSMGSESETDTTQLKSKGVESKNIPENNPCAVAPKPGGAMLSA